MSQKKEILHYLENGHALTSREATIKFGCTRLAARIADTESRYKCCTIFYAQIEGV